MEGFFAPGDFLSVFDVFFLSYDEDFYTVFDFSFGLGLSGRVEEVIDYIDFGYG